jgi:BON domain
MLRRHPVGSLAILSVAAVASFHIYGGARWWTEDLPAPAALQQATRRVEGTRYDRVGHIEYEHEGGRTIFRADSSTVRAERARVPDADVMVARAVTRALQEKGISGYEIDFDVTDGVATLRGTIPSESTRDDVLRTVRGCREITGVDDLMVVHRVGAPDRHDSNSTSVLPGSELDSPDHQASRTGDR